MQKAYMEVTREFVHRIPSHPWPQGSEPTQLGGVFCHISLRESRATSAYEF